MIITLDNVEKEIRIEEKVIIQDLIDLLTMMKIDFNEYSIVGTEDIIQYLKYDEE